MDRKALVIMLMVLLAVTLAAQVGFSPEQQKQFAQCTAAAEKVQTEVRALLALAKAPDFSAAKLKVQAPRLQQAYAAMHEQHKALLEPLEGDLAKAVETRKKTMDEACMRIRASLKELELAAAAAAPEAKKVAQQAEVIQTELDRWLTEHRRIGAGLGVK